MIRFLFWNVNGVASLAERSRSGVRPLAPGDARYRRVQKAIKILAGRRSLDVIVLAESPFEGRLGITGFVEARTSLKANATTRTRLEIYHRNTVAFTGFQVIERTVLMEMSVVSSQQTILLAPAHLDSPLHLSPETRKRKLEGLAADIYDKERAIGHSRTLLVGDLNYDPYDEPMISAYGLNAVASKAVARQRTRPVHRNSFPYFYNPMWAHLSDATSTPPGTYYRKTREVDCRLWYLPDQVLIRQDLLDFWQDQDLDILSEVGKISLLDRQDRPNRKKFSDHLPLSFALDL